MKIVHSSSFFGQLKGAETDRMSAVHCQSGHLHVLSSSAANIGDMGVSQAVAGS